jgi:hypothetical protein
LARLDAVKLPKSWPPAFINGDLHCIDFDSRKMKTPLRIAILECDTPLPDIIERYGRYGRIFSTLLETAADGLGLSPKKDLELSAFDVVDKQEYPDLDDIDAILISGSSSSHIETILVLFINNI